MVMVRVRGYDINVVSVKSSFNRKAQQFKNNTINSLRKLGLIADDVEIELERVAIKNVPAEVEWYFDDQRLYYSYKGMNTYVDNLFVVSKVIELEVEAYLKGEKSKDDFIRHFSEDEDVAKKRKEARRLLGVPEDCLDMELINKKYKELAKKYHPDMPTGDIVMFKKVNNAHKLIKRELE